MAKCPRLARPLSLGVLLPMWLTFFIVVYMLLLLRFSVFLLLLYVSIVFSNLHWSYMFRCVCLVGFNCFLYVALSCFIYVCCFVGAFRLFYRFCVIRVLGQLVSDRYSAIHTDLRWQRGSRYLRQMGDGLCGAGSPLDPYPWHCQEGQRVCLPDAARSSDISCLSFMVPARPFCAKWRSF